MPGQGIESSLEAETPALWAVEEVAAPIVERLRAHFAAGRPTDRPDRPEWLFETALRLVRQLAPATAPLQAAVEVHGLGDVYHVPLEFARAIRGAVKVGPPKIYACTLFTFFWHLLRHDQLESSCLSAFEVMSWTEHRCISPCPHLLRKYP